jgi:hypothetical protein
VCTVVSLIRCKNDSYNYNITSRVSLRYSFIILTASARPWIPCDANQGDCSRISAGMRFSVEHEENENGSQIDTYVFVGSHFVLNSLTYIDDFTYPEQIANTLPTLR